MRLRGIFVYAAIDAMGSEDTHDGIEIVIENISKNGIGFRMTTPIKVVVNEIYHVKFALESEQRISVLSKDILIKWVGRDFVGAEFIHPIDDYEFELDFYLSGKKLSTFDE